MQCSTIDPIIARRRLTQSGSSELLVEIGAPRPFDDGTGWYCPYRIGGEGSRIGWIGGVDGVQALRLAIRVIGAELQGLVNSGQHLTWDGSPDLGFQGDP